MNVFIKNTAGLTNKRVMYKAKVSKILRKGNLLHPPNLCIFPDFCLQWNYICSTKIWWRGSVYFLLRHFNCDKNSLSEYWRSVIRIQPEQMIMDKEHHRLFRYGPLSSLFHCLFIRFNVLERQKFFGNMMMEQSGFVSCNDESSQDCFTSCSVII